MLDFDFYRELKKGKRYKRNAGYLISENGSTALNRADNSSENAEEEVAKIHALTQEAVSEGIKGFIAPLQTQPEKSCPSI